MGKVHVTWLLSRFGTILVASKFCRFLRCIHELVHQDEKEQEALSFFTSCTFVIHQQQLLAHVFERI